MWNFLSLSISKVSCVVCRMILSVTTNLKLLQQGLFQVMTGQNESFLSEASCNSMANSHFFKDFCLQSFFTSRLFCGLLLYQYLSGCSFSSRTDTIISILHLQTGLDTFLTSKLQVFSRPVPVSSIQMPLYIFAQKSAKIPIY